ncbi:MAG: hypothetical protein JNK76_14780 [Planctomycetales bacterium]|nr:hypothetical protein [Planctomycetales bacterium]MBN8626832.1 hypothetical protein [Planctomycetota bacterium]
MSRLERSAWITLPMIAVLLVTASASAEGLKLWPTSLPDLPKPPNLGVTKAVRQTLEVSTTASKRALSTSAKVTKKAWSTTVDVVTLKPLRAAPPQKKPSQFKLGLHPDPQTVSGKPQTGPLGTLFAPKATVAPRTASNFFAQERVR